MRRDIKNRFQEELNTYKIRSPMFTVDGKMMFGGGDDETKVPLSDE